ncbi:uncharacterized protein LOC133905763 [Phragmites australis]|uniref:uncharacterized protein LOC133905763 n=1 Tax=Phragmites australis TaxID=29695 RepID=UPI002D7996FA|nr:uncharacterized protein LOC133905763 [Phragmites australis]
MHTYTLERTHRHHNHGTATTPSPLAAGLCCSFVPPPKPLGRSPLRAAGPSTIQPCCAQSRFIACASCRAQARAVVSSRTDPTAPLHWYSYCHCRTTSASTTTSSPRPFK